VYAENPREAELADLNQPHIFKCAECTRALMELRESREQAKPVGNSHAAAHSLDAQ
jgi:hypothetical protein